MYNLYTLLLVTENDLQYDGFIRIVEIHFINILSTLYNATSKQKIIRSGRSIR